MTSSTITTTKSVAFHANMKTIETCSEEQDEDEQSTFQRKSIKEGDAVSQPEPLFPGLYPVVLVNLKQTSIPRIWCLRMVASPWFERISMLVILINCITLGLYQPCNSKNDAHCETERCIILEMFDHLVFAFFAAEMLIKMLAMGVWGKLGYLGEAWNRLDLFIVLCGMLEYILQMNEAVNFSAVRTVRVLRPLRAINRVPSMRILVMLLLDTLPMLGNVLMLCSFVFFIFGVLAVQLWAGTLRQRCFVDNQTDILLTERSIKVSRFYEETFNEEVPVCSLQLTNNGVFNCADDKLVIKSRIDNITCSLNISAYTDGSTTDTLYLNNGTLDCINWNQYYKVCKVGDENPSQGAINFDNIMYAWVAIFQVISLEGWVDIMYYVMDGYSFYSFFYFIVLIVIGSFFMINLCLVVIATQFSETKQREQRLMEEQRLRFKSNDSTLASYSPPGNCYEEMLKYISHVYRKTKRKIQRRWHEYKRKRKTEQEAVKHSKSLRKKSKLEEKSLKLKTKHKAIHLHHHHHHHHHHYHIAEPPGLDQDMIVKMDVPLQLPAQSLAGNRLMLTDGRTDAEFSELKTPIRLTVPNLSSAHSNNSIRSSVTSVLQSSPPTPSKLSGDVIMNSTTAVYFRSRSASPGNKIFDHRKTKKPIDVIQHKGQYIASNLSCTCRKYDVEKDESFEPAAECAVTESNICVRENCWTLVKREIQNKAEYLCNYMSKMSLQTKGIVESRYFNRGIMVAILVNTLSMGIEHHKQPETLTYVLDISNIVFTTLFALEMLTKLFAFGFVGYIRNFYNVFDAVIVVISVWEIAVVTESGSGGWSVLRTFRLLRVLKLIRFLPALRRQLVVLMKTMDNVATFMMLLALFIFIFSILGMHLFGCKFCWVQFDETICDRKNFDSLLWAFVTVFQILTQEDWNMVLYNGMAAASPYAAIYFVTLMTIGNYVLFNLLVAILVEGFQAECYSDSKLSLETSESETDDEKRDTRFTLAEKYTNRIAKALGLPNQPLKHGNMHDAGDRDGTEYESSTEDDTDEEVEKANPIINIISTIDHEPDESFAKSTTNICAVTDTPRSLPTITHTKATPATSPTPFASPSSQRKSLMQSFCNHVSVNPHTSSNNSLPNNLPFEKSTHCASLTSENLAVNGNRNDDVVRKETPSRKGSTESCLSVGSTISQTGSWRSKRFKKLPLDQQSLVSWENDNCQEDNLNNYDYLDGKNQENFTGCSAYENSIVKESYVMEEVDKKINGSCLSAAYPISTTHGYSEITYRNVGCGCVPAFCVPCQDERPPYWLFERFNWSLYLFSPSNRFRQIISKATSSKYFDNIILLFIFGNCVTIAMERPALKENLLESEIIKILNYVFTVVFTIEMMLKVVVSGFYIGEEKPYLKSGWNVLDFFLVVTSLIDSIMTLVSPNELKLIGILRIFRLLRALRPLRVISRAPGLKLVVQTLISSLKPIGNIVLICCAFFVIFGILGVQLFKGKFYYCDGEDVRKVINKTDCENILNYEWKNQPYNFDDLGQALMSLFVLASKDGWVEIMYNGIDAVDVDKQPIENNNPVVLLYFISFLLIVGFFVINMFVGVVVENFHRCREEHELQEIKRKKELRRKKEERLLHKHNRRLMRGKQRNQALHKRTLSRARNHAKSVRGICLNIWTNIRQCCEPDQKDTEKYYEKYGTNRRVLHSLCVNKYFEIAVSAIIGINILTMALEHYNQPKTLDLALRYANYFFTAVFILEAAMKLVSFGMCRYFKDKWNILDMLIIVLSVTGIVVEDMKTNLFINPTIIRVMRVLRIARVLKLLKVSKGIRSLLETVACALPQVGNLGMLFMLLFFIFAALGVELFGEIKCDVDHVCEGLNRHATFENFGIALLTLFRISTGDNWNGIMKDTLRNDCHLNSNCQETYNVNRLISPLYFIVFVMMAQFVLVNVVVAVLMKQLEDSRAENADDEDDDEDDNMDDENENDYEDEGDDMSSNFSAHKDEDNEVFDLNIKHKLVTHANTEIDENHPLLTDKISELSLDASSCSSFIALSTNHVIKLEDVIVHDKSIPHLTKTAEPEKSETTTNGSDDLAFTMSCETLSDNIASTISNYNKQEHTLVDEIGEDDSTKKNEISAEIHSIPCLQPMLVNASINHNTRFCASSIHVSGSKSAETSPSRVSNLSKFNTSIERNTILSKQRMCKNSQSAIQLPISAFNAPSCHLPLQASKSDPSTGDHNAALLKKVLVSSQESVTSATHLSKSCNEHSLIKRRLSDNIVRPRPIYNHIHHHHHYFPLSTLSLSLNKLSSSQGTVSSKQAAVFVPPLCSTTIHPGQRKEIGVNSYHCDPKDARNVHSLSATEHVNKEETLKESMCNNKLENKWSLSPVKTTSISTNCTGVIDNKSTLKEVSTASE